MPSWTRALSTDGDGRCPFLFPKLVHGGPALDKLLVSAIGYVQPVFETCVLLLLLLLLLIQLPNLRLFLPLCLFMLSSEQVNV